MIDDAWALCAHVSDQLLLLNEVRNEANHYWKETFFNHLVHDALHDKVKLMHFAPNTKERTIVMQRILKSSHNTSNMPGHISSSIWQQTKKASLAIRTKYCQEVKDHFEHDFIRMLLEH
jgi:hypothetical protein